VIFIHILLKILPIIILLISNSSYFTYYSGENAIISLGKSKNIIKELNYINYDNIIEDFSNPPYTYADQWAINNNWSYSGTCPSWWGYLWCGITSNGYLQWHNWFHSIGGAIYDFKIWKEFNTVGREFELYVPISMGRAVSSGIAGAPALYITISLYDSSNTKIFSFTITQDYYIKEIKVSFYNNEIVKTLNTYSIQCKLWQNSTGAYFSYDNGTNIIASGMLYTEPSKIEIRFYIWEYNSIQPYSDYEYWINIDKIILRPLSYDFRISGLSAGNWYLLDNNGNIIKNISSNIHGNEISYSNKLDGMLVGLINYTYDYKDKFYANTTIIYNSGIFSSIQNKPITISIFDPCDSINNWNGLKGQLNSYQYVSFSCSGSLIYEYCGAVNTGFSSWNPWMERNISIYCTSINISFNNRFYKYFGNTFGCYFKGISIRLLNGSYININDNFDISDQQWHIISYNISFNEPQIITSIKFNWYSSGSYYYSFYLYIDNVSITYYGNLGLTIKGIPENDIVNIYQNNSLKKSIISNGSDIIISPIEIPQPFEGHITVISRDYLRPITKYSGAVDWNDILIYSDGILVKSNTNIQLQQAFKGSECNSIDGWKFSYNLVTGGTTPSFSSSDGYVKFYENSLSYYSGPYGDEAPRMEAWYYLVYDVNSIGKNFTISLLADGYFHYYSASGYVYDSWGEILVYYIQKDNWYLIIQSNKSENPILNITITLFPYNVSNIDKIAIVFHTYGCGPSGYALYSSPQWGRVDYIRINYLKVPDDYSGMKIIGLNSGWRVVIDNYTFWTNSLGEVIIPINITTWPLTTNIIIYPYSEFYRNNFELSKIYYIKTIINYEPTVDTIYYEINTINYNYRVELKIISSKILPMSSSIFYSITFTFKTYENNILLPEVKPKVTINGIVVDIERISNYTWKLISPEKAIINAHDPYSGICLTGFINNIQN